jgi:hypothetical protein
MATDTAEIQVDEYLDAVAVKLRERFPLFTTVKCFPEDRSFEDIALPAMLFEITEFETAPTHDYGSGQAPVDVRVELHMLFDFKTPNIKRRLPAIAASVLAFVNLQRWGFKCEAAEALGASPDSFEPGMDQFATWRVEWHQVLKLGDNVWDADPSWSPPTQVFVTGTQPMLDGHPSLAPYGPQYADSWLVQKAEDASILEWLG